MTSLRFLNETDDIEALKDFADALERRLTPIGAARLLAVAFRVATRDVALEIGSAALGDLSTGQPGTPFISIASEAREWTYFASLIERKIYLAAIWQSLFCQEQAAFWRFVQTKVAA